ncbi:MAG: pyrroline-5-carboxylate reductase [Clostridia bacterium]
MNYKYKIGFIGAGNMANCILNGIISNNIVKNNDIILSRANIPQNNTNNYNYITDNNYVLQNCEYVILAVKPQVFETIKSQLSNAKCKVIISIMAGVSSSTIKNLCNDINVVRIMPNTPCMIGEGMSCILKDSAQPQQLDFIKNIFASIGKIEMVEESQFDAVVSVSGSGPAYVYAFIDAMIKGGINGGLSPETSKILTLQTFLGATKMVQNSEEPISSLIQKVCSKGGTTIQAIDSFKQDNLEQIICNGIEKCKNRSIELGAKK